MDILEIVLDSTGFVYDPLQPTLQTEKLSYMLNVALEGATIRLPVKTEEELENAQALNSRLVDALSNGISGEDLDETPSLEGLISELYVAMSQLNSVQGIVDKVQSVVEVLDNSLNEKDEGGIMTVAHNWEILRGALQDIAGSAGVTLDAYGDVIEIARNEPVQEG
jgi:hypothetical protein